MLREEHLWRVHTLLHQSGNHKCPFCNSDRDNRTDEEDVKDLMKRVEANDAASIYFLANDYYNGTNSLQQDQTKAMELYVRAANLGNKKAHNNLAGIYHEGGHLKKAKFHNEAAAMAGNEVARCIVGLMEKKSGNMDRAVKHWTIGASAGCYHSMHEMRFLFEQGVVSRESIDSTLAAYNSSCVEMRSEARDACIQFQIDRI
jgi:TPR repeat protein